jgi:hypothetical protein
LQWSAPFSVICARHLEAVQFREYVHRLARRELHPRRSENLGGFAVHDLVTIGRSDDLGQTVSAMNCAVRGGAYGKAGWKVAEVLSGALGAGDDNANERDSARS